VKHGAKRVAKSLVTRARRYQRGRTTVAQQLAERARQHEAERDWDAAAAAWHEALARDPRPAEWHFRCGRILEEQGNKIGAVHAYRAAIARDPRPARWHFRLGQVLRATGDWGPAAHAHRRAEALWSHRDPELRGVRGRQLPYVDRIELGIVRKPVYAYGLYRAARTASRLGVDHISAVELGVAGGKGLLALEAHASDIERMFDLKVDVYGLDTGQGLLTPEDHRDLPYHFAEGNYVMEEERLRARLTRAQLVLGDAAVTFAELFDGGLAPLGFVSFDMDHYTPTAAVLARMGDDSSHDRFLPRLPLYFDDVYGRRGQDYNRFTGELLAIREFNDANEQVKVDEDRYFRSVPLNYEWHHGCYILHRFEHPRYGDYVNTSSARTLRLPR
jgi:tetratricopeptide (TPR) repeat protein